MNQAVDLLKLRRSVGYGSKGKKKSLLRVKYYEGVKGHYFIF